MHSPTGLAYAAAVLPSTLARAMLRQNAMRVASLAPSVVATSSASADDASNLYLNDSVHSCRLFVFFLKVCFCKYLKRFVSGLYVLLLYTRC